jgi:hypothetical protein
VSSTKAKPTENAVEIVARLWPPPDPVNYARREAIARLGAADRRLRNALELRQTAEPILFSDLERLHVRVTRAEVLVALQHLELTQAAREVEAALDLLAAARQENDLRTLEERRQERLERRTRHA